MMDTTAGTRRRAVAAGAAVVMVVAGLSVTAQPALGVLAKLNDDAYVELGYPGGAPSGPTATNYGSDAVLRVQGPYAKPEQRSFIKFDLSAVPTNDPGQVRSATLTLFAHEVTGPGVLSVSTVADGGAAWTEGAVSGQSAPELAATAPGCTSYPLTKVINAADKGAFITFDVTCLVQGWIQAPSSNQGIALRYRTKNLVVAFDSKEATDTSHPPTLEITLGSVAPAGKN